MGLYSWHHVCLSTSSLGDQNWVLCLFPWEFWVSITPFKEPKKRKRKRGNGIPFWHHVLEGPYSFVVIGFEPHGKRDKLVRPRFYHSTLSINKKWRERQDDGELELVPRYPLKIGLQTFPVGCLDLSRTIYFFFFFFILESFQWRIYTNTWECEWGLDTTWSYFTVLQKFQDWFFFFFCVFFDSWVLKYSHFYRKTLILFL